MGILSTLILLPVKAPVDGAFWVARKLAEHVEEERNSPAALRAALAEAERQLVSGELSEDAYEEIEDELISRLAEVSK